MRKEDCYFLGKIVRRHGLSGNVILKLDTDQPELYNKLESIFIEISGLLVPFFIEKLFWSQFYVLNIAFKHSSESMIGQVVGKNVYLPLSTLPKLSGKQFYYHEVIGYNIYDENDNDCGVIHSVNDQTLQNCFILELEGREIVIPLIKEWILEVNRKEQFIKMHLPEGLMDVFLVPSKKDQ